MQYAQGTQLVFDAGPGIRDDPEAIGFAEGFDGLFRAGIKDVVVHIVGSVLGEPSEFVFGQPQPQLFGDEQTYLNMRGDSDETVRWF